MKPVTKYLCEICGTEHKTADSATKCEEKHYKTLEFTAIYSSDAVLPSEIKLTYIGKNGKKNSQRYRRGYY